jgi:AraC-like DNA-binding protein
MTQTIRKREGFEGQRAIVLPKKILEVCQLTPPTNALYITDIGYYPRARYHYRERPAGISQNIFIYCIDGKGWVQLPSGVIKINPNEFLIIPADMPHKYGADEESPWSIYWTHFKGIQTPYFAALLTKQFKSFVNYVVFLDERIKLLESIYSSLQGGYSHDNLAFSSISFTYFLSSLSFPEKFGSIHHKLQKDVVDISIEFMQNHLHVLLTLEELASSVNLSSSHYSNIFRKKTGYSPIVYFNHLKIQHACQYLQFTNLRISEISVKIGIDDQYYFSRMFTKIMGLPPAEYRKRKQ